jgi:hypothetical protein
VPEPSIGHAVDATEAILLQHRVGHVFPARVVEADDERGTVVLTDPPVRARCDGSGLPVGQEIDVGCTVADLGRREVRFEPVA